MSFVFSKNKEKRSRSSSSESNSSFVKNVTSRVSGFLPAGITKWFSSPSSSGTNGSAAVVDGTDSSTEDEAPESIAPPAKRTRYSSPLGKYSNLTTSETTTTSNVVTETGSVLYNSIQSPLGRNSFRRDPNFVSTPIRSHTDDMNMSGIMDRSERSNPFMQHTVSAIGQSIARKRKSLFDSDKQQEQSMIACAKTAAHQVKDPKQPHFKPHLLGSPFYPGGTMYGGASATTFVNHPSIKKRKMAYVNESKDSETVNMSISSRRVMDLLENYSSPLIEAKRIPRYELYDLCDINRSIQPSTSSKNSFKTQELYVPTTANLIRMKARNRLMDSTKAARQIIASHSSSLSYKPYAAPSKRESESEPASGKSQFKLNTRLTRSNQDESHLIMPEPVELPTGVLQIDQNNLPKFSFGGSTPSPMEKPAKKPSSEGFNFSTPYTIATEIGNTSPKAPSFNFGSPDKAQVNASPPKFSFGVQNSTEPKKKSQPEKEEPPKVQNPAPTSILAFAKKSDDWKCSDCWVSNKVDAKQCACCGAKQPAKQNATTSDTTPKCTTCKLSNSQPNSDKCVNCEKLKANKKPANSLPDKTAKWKCSDCWVDNNPSAEKCVCCGSRKTQKSATPAPAALAAPAAPAVPAADKDWRCEDCLITNKPSIEKCAACGGAKPGTKPAPKKLPSIKSSTLFNNDNKMVDIVETQKSHWECSVCLVSNTSDKQVCPCCRAAKPETDNAPSKFTNFKFNSDANSGFKFGIDPKVQETKLAEKEKSEAPKPKVTEESETNNNVVPSYTFTLPSKKPDKVVSKPSEEPKSSFAFGIPKENAKATEDPKPSFSFGVQKESTKPAEEKKPAFSFGVPKQDAKTNEDPKPPAYSFSVPKENSKSTAPPKSFSFGVPKEAAKTSEEPKPSFSFDTTKQASKIAEEPKSTFSFGFAKQNATSVATGLVPAVSKTPDLLKPAEDKEKPQEVPSISLKPAEASPFSSNLFASPSLTSNPQNAMNAFLNNSTDAKATASPSVPLTQQNAVSEAPKLQFSAGAGNATTNSLFSAPSSTTSNSLITPAAPAKPLLGGIFSKPESTASPAITAPATPFQNNVQSTPALPASSTPFSFGSNASTNPAEKVSFRFGSSTTSTPTFGATSQASPSPFGLAAGNPLTNGPSNPLGGNGISTNPLAQSISGNTLGNVGGTSIAPAGNGILGSGTSSVFNAPAQDTPRPWNVNVNQFGATPAPSPFGAAASTPAREGFTFGATSAPAQFGAAATNPAPAQFGTGTSNQTTPQFGAAATNLQPNVFGASAPSSQFMYGMGQNASSRPATLFGSSQPSPMNAMPAAMSTFEAPAPTPPSSFNFGAPQTSAGIFGFGQQPQQPALGGMQQPNMYSFGGGASPGPVQFNMGSAPSSAASRRPVRKAVRRTQQR